MKKEGQQLKQEPPSYLTTKVVFKNDDSKRKRRVGGPGGGGQERTHRWRTREIDAVDIHLEHLITEHGLGFEKLGKKYRR